MKAIRNFYLLPAAGLAMAAFTLAAQSQTQLPHATSPSGTVIVQGYYQEAGVGGCSMTNTCVVTFSPVPTGDTLIVTNVSCNFNTLGTSALTTYALVLKGDIPFNATGFSALTPTPVGQGGGIYFYASNNDVQQIFKSGKTPQILIAYQGSLASILIACQIGGKLLT